MMAGEDREQWQRLLYVLENRNKSTVIVITVHDHETAERFAADLSGDLPRYRFHPLDLADCRVTSIRKLFVEKLPETVLKSHPAEYIVNVFGLENSALFMTESGKIEQSEMIAELNFEREIVFREFPFITIFWLDAAGVENVRKGAPDFWDWLTYHFVFKEKPETNRGRVNIEIPTIVPEVEGTIIPKTGRILDLNQKLDTLKKESPNERSFREQLSILKLLGREYLNLQNYENAVSSFEQALEIGGRVSLSDYETADIQIHLGTAHRESGEYESAFQIYQDALSLQSNIGNAFSGVIYENIGNIFEKRGKWDDAIETYRSARKWYEQTQNLEEMGETVYRLGRVHEKSGQWNEALEHYRDAVNVYEKSESREKIKKTNVRISEVMKHRRMRNPYIHRQQIPPDSDMFFGRQAEMNRILDMLRGENPQSVSIVGERRIGKSSLAIRLHHALREEDRMVTVFLDCAGLSRNCDTRGKFFGKLNRKFRGYRDRFIGYGDALFTDYSSFEDFIEDETANGYRFVIFMDEFEKLPRMRFADNSFFSNLRSLANRFETRLAYVTISQSSLKGLTHQVIDTSEFWNIFSQEIIGLLDEASIMQLEDFGFDRNGMILRQEKIYLIEYYAGRFPFFNQIVYSRLFEEMISDLPVSRDSLEAELMDHYEILWRHRSAEEQQLLMDWKSKATQEDFIFRRLRNKGILEKKNNRYRPFSGFFERLLDGIF